MSAIARRPAAGRRCAGGVRLHVSPWVRPMSRGRITMASTLARMARCRKPNQYANSAERHFRVKENGRSGEEKNVTRQIRSFGSRKSPGSLAACEFHAIRGYISKG
ncbi:hypothetical protein [Stenotrophomonas sp.]|uniref:hypothetical protein n=1 Tax=Stenotrophomonas sp. TaxID=69392 RepID=UPI0028AD9376|nr:hypothetical protein [Stenotrophomonas sp.]